ncbi:MAG: 50S ribosomal protein L37ae [Candidatus Aenigmatarchaeota archaeon]
MGKTKKIGSAGRYGPKYGKKIREKIADIEREQKRRHICPNCKMEYLVREGSGIWICKKCGVKFAGQAYYPPRVI